MCCRHHFPAIPAAACLARNTRRRCTSIPSASSVVHRLHLIIESKLAGVRAAGTHEGAIRPHRATPSVLTKIFPCTKLSEGTTAVASPRRMFCSSMAKAHQWWLQETLAARPSRCGDLQHDAPIIRLSNHEPMGIRSGEGSSKLCVRPSLNSAVDAADIQHSTPWPQAQTRRITTSTEAAAAARSSIPRGELRPIPRPTPRTPLPHTILKSAPPPPSWEPAELRRSAPPATARRSKETGGARFHEAGVFASVKF